MTTTAPNAIAVPCPECGAEARSACYYAPRPGTWWPRDPHPERVAAARDAERARSANPRTDSDRRLAIALMIQRAGDAELAAIHELLLVREAMRHGVDGMVRVFRAGAAKHNGGRLGIAPGVTIEDCAAHLAAHAKRVEAAPDARDPDTGELDAHHVSARGVMVGQLDSVQRGEVW